MFFLHENDIQADVTMMLLKLIHKLGDIIIILCI